MMSESVDSTVECATTNTNVPSILGVDPRDVTGFVLLLVPFGLAWTIGFFHFSSFWAFLIAAAVYWSVFSTVEYEKRHARLQALIASVAGVKEGEANEEQRLSKYKEFKALGIATHRIPTHLMHADFQRAEWLNHIIAQMWPFISDYIKRILRETVEPSVKALLPQFKIQFTELNLGEAAPRISAIKVYEPKDGDDRSRIELDCQLAWVSSAEVKLKILASTAEIEKLQFFGRMRITLEPLLSEPPLLGGMSFTLLNHPDVEYQLSGLAAVANAPGIKAAVQRAVNDAIATYLVLPNRIDVPIATLETNYLHFRLPEGVLRIAVIQARDLHNMDAQFLLQGKSDPYARVKVGSEEKQTPTIDSNLNPTWAPMPHQREAPFKASDFIFDFPVHDVVNQQVIVELWDKDNDADDFLGECKVYVHEVYNAFIRKREQSEGLNDDETDEKGYIECWRKLEGKNIKQGEVKLRLNWLQFKCDDQPGFECHPEVNKYFLGAFVNSVSNLPDAVRGRQVIVDLSLSRTDQMPPSSSSNFRGKNSQANSLHSQSTHPAVAPDCSFAETKWFFQTDAKKFLHYQVNQMTQDKTIAHHRIGLSDLIEDDNQRWAQAIDTNLKDGEKGTTNLKSTVALRRLDGHPDAFQLPYAERVMEKSKSSKSPISSHFGSMASIRGSTGTLANPEDFREKPVLTTLSLTWRYSQNSEIVTIVLHSVAKDFPPGAKVKFRNGRKYVDSSHFDKGRLDEKVEEKLELKKINIDSTSMIECLVRLKAKTLGIGQIDLQEDMQVVQIHRIN